MDKIMIQQIKFDPTLYVDTFHTLEAQLPHVTFQ